MPRPLFPDSVWIGASLERRLRERTRVRLHKYARHDPETADRARRWLAAWPAPAWRHAPRLCLDDVGKGNLIGGPDGVAIVDVVGTRMESVPVELGRVRHMLLDNRRDPWKAFLGAYLGSAAPALAEQVERLGRFGEALYLLKHNIRRGRFRRNRGGHARLLRLLETDP
jgi:hypothetical protein